MKQQTYKTCQSCAMPLKYDPQRVAGRNAPCGGTESDGAKSAMYCSYCYQDGKFNDNFTTSQEMQEFCMKKLVEMKYPRIIAWLFTRGIPKLERWKK